MVWGVSLTGGLTAPGDPLTSLFKPVQPPTAFEQTVERLATAIKLGFLPPGGQLPPERELARQLEISRTTLRQALTALTQSGLVTTSRGRRGGTFVADPLPLAPRPRRVFDEDELRAFLDHRLAVEMGVAVRAAERAAGADLDALVGLTDEMDESMHDFESYRQADLRFHMGLAEAAHSPRLVEAMAEIQSELDEVIELVPHPQEVLQRSNDQHRALIALLRKNDADGAAKLIREHVEGTEYFLAGMLPR
jgi:GntR family transcriptional regulator, transcriptional repressor for pyruvate dehydrogenase complex